MNSITNKIIVVCGATASGKSARAIDIARESDGVIINADAMQVYHEMSVLTARPDQEQCRLAPHLLYGIISVTERFSVAKWLNFAKQKIDEAFDMQKLPIVTGGTGMYIKALIEGLSPIPDIPKEIRQKATDMWNESGAESLIKYDNVMAERLKSGDKQRHIRALEVILATGKSLALWQEMPRIKPYSDTKFIIDYIQLPRAELYRRCDLRFIQMMQNGALEEAKTLHAMKLAQDMPARTAVGLRELLKFLDGEYNIEEAIKKAQQATRNYAKRQLTWFNNQINKF